MQSNLPPNKTLTFSQKVLVWTAFLGVLLFLFLNWWWLHCMEPAERGTTGDMFGAVNALFTGLAFAGVVYTVILQRNDLKIQQDELSTSKGEALEQKKVLNQQRFESTFFHLLDLQNEIIYNLQLNGSEGRKVFDDAYETLIILLNGINARSILEEAGSQTYTTFEITHSITTIPTTISNARALLLSKYFPGYYNKYSSSFNHYFRNLYHTFKFIYFSDLEPAEKSFYASLCRAQLSQNELFAISFNILIDGYGRPNFLFLVKEFDILQNFETDKIVPKIYWELIQDEIKRVEYPFATKPKPTVVV